LVRGDFKEAVSNAELALSYDNENVAVLLNSAVAYYGAQSYNDAIANCEKVLSKEQNNPQALFLLAQSYMWLGGYKIAAESFQKILAVDTNDAFQLRSKTEAGLALALRKMAETRA
jgi:tetratricopeptide (TPR) repeat protein